MRASLWLWGVLSWASFVAAQPHLRSRAQPRASTLERGLLSRAPVRVPRGGTLSLLVQTASGLTPPPGIQQERALRGFAARLCGRQRVLPDATSLERAAELTGCTPLAPRNFRPRDAHSLVYRVEFAVPGELTEGAYDLEVRFPGGSDRAWAGVAIVSPASALSGPSASSPEALDSPRVAAGCSLGGGRSVRQVWGLLLAALSWRLAAGGRARVRRWNSSHRTSVSRGP